MDGSTARPGTPTASPAPVLRLAHGSTAIALSLQPSPTLTRVVHFRLFRWTVTAIMRHWRPGESGPSGPCRLCPSCTAYEDGCLKVVAGTVSRQDAALFDTRAASRQPPITGPTGSR